MKHTVKIRKEGSSFVLECANCSLAGVFTSEERVTKFKTHHRETGEMFPPRESNYISDTLF